MSQDAESNVDSFKDATKEQSGTPGAAGARSRIIKNSAELDMFELRDKAVDSLVDIIKTQESSAALGVRSTRRFAPGLTTTMVHPGSQDML